MAVDHPAPWKLVPIGSLTTGEECTGMCIQDGNGHQVFTIASSKRTSEWNGPVSKETTERQEALLQRIVDAINHECPECSGDCYEARAARDLEPERDESRD